MGKLVHKLSLATAVATLSLSAMPAPAATVYSYDFVATDSWDGLFTGYFSADVASDAFVTTAFDGGPVPAAVLNPGQWDRCGGTYDSAQAHCSSIGLFQGVYGGAYDAVDFQFYTTDRDVIYSYTYYFAPGAFNSTRPWIGSPITGHIQDDGNLTPAGATLNAVPEPSTWAMMIMGFIGLGAMLRRQRRTPIRARA